MENPEGQQAGQPANAEGLKGDTQLGAGQPSSALPNGDAGGPFQASLVPEPLMELDKTGRHPEKTERNGIRAFLDDAKRPMEVFTLVIVLATVGQVLIGYWQFQSSAGQLAAMKEQNLSMERQTESLLQQTLLLNEQTKLMARQLTQAEEAAKGNEIQFTKSLQYQLDQSRKALDNTMAIFRNDQRAWVGVSSVSFDQVMEQSKPPKVLIHLLNSGKTPAVNVAVASTLVSRRNLMPTDLNGPLVGLRVSNLVMLPNSTFAAEAVSDEPFSKQEQIQAIQSGANRLFAIGTVYYVDVFRRAWKTNFCFRFERANSGGPLIGAACAEHNSVE